MSEMTAPAGKGSMRLLAAAFGVAFSVLLLVPIWSAMGVLDTEAGHGDHGAATVMAAEDFQARVDQQLERFGQADGSVAIPPGTDVFVMARQYAFVPRTIHLKRGETYDLVFYAADVMHGVSLIMGGSLSSVLLPGTPVTIRVRPTASGTIALRCTEYCGAGHHAMTASITVGD
ncbi:hypothetical protein DCC79_13905 [bacterium]|nr:hypothetical protein [Chloroflexi bacterium CFX6]RIL08404.1 MAG: hypothetical protein DCC79_13905 [bacterium]